MASGSRTTSIIRDYARTPSWERRRKHLITTRGLPLTHNHDIVIVVNLNQLATQHGTGSGGGGSGCRDAESGCRYGESRCRDGESRCRDGESRCRDGESRCSERRKPELLVCINPDSNGRKNIVGV